MKFIQALPRGLAAQVVLCALVLTTPLVGVADNLKPAPQGQLALSSSATLDVTKDLLSVTLSTTREGADATTVQSQLKQALDAALLESKKVARPGQLDVHTGNFSLSPRYTNKGVINGWQGSTELVVEGRDMPAIAQLSGRLSSLTIQHVDFGLSRELREKSEAEVSKQAIARFRAQAADYAVQFGYSGYVLSEVAVSHNEPQPMMQAQMMRSKALSSYAEAPLPVEPGKGSVTVSVSGTVQLTK
jgi:predicted secreted protein